jgi:hypothetical protein
MGAPGGGLKQCAQGWGQDRTSVGSPHMPKATFPFVTARQWVDGWRLFFLNTATVSAGHSNPCTVCLVRTEVNGRGSQLITIQESAVQQTGCVYEL